jgi:hypothetical protein
MIENNEQDGTYPTRRPPVFAAHNERWHTLSRSRSLHRGPRALLVSLQPELSARRKRGAGQSSREL